MIANFLHKKLGTDNLPKSLRYIIFTDIGERFSFYGISSIATLYMISYLNFSEASAVSSISFCRSAGFLAQILTIYIAAKLLSKYHIILYSLIAVAFGHIILGQMLDSAHGLMIGVFIVFVMTGMMKPVNLPFLINQCNNNHKLSSAAVAINYWAFNIGMAMALISVPYIYKIYGPRYGFMLPAVVAIISAIVIFSGRATYEHNDVSGEKPTASITATILTYIHAKINNKSWSEEVKKKHGYGEVEDIKKIGILSVIWIGSVFFLTAYENIFHAMIVHSEKLNPYVFGIKVIPAQLQVINALIPVCGLPIVRGFLLPLMFQQKQNIAQITAKMSFGALIMSAGYLVVVIIEVALKNGNTIDATWAIIPWMMISVAETITYVYLLEVFNSYVSFNNRVTTSVMFTLSNFISGAILSVIAKMYGKIDAKYFGISVLCGLISIVFFTIAGRLYKSTIIYN